MSQISIVIPTFNRKDVLQRALDSVVAQTFADWELVVVDDASTDGTQEFFEAWAKNRPQKIKFIRLEENLGVSAARNRGVKESKAPWIAFLDSDDEWLSDKLEKQWALHKDFLFIHGEEIWMRRGVKIHPRKKHLKMGGRIFSRCAEICCVSPSTVLVRRDLFEEAHGFREDFPVCEDYELWLRLSAQVEFGFVSSAVTIKYGGNPDQLSTRFFGMDYFRAKALFPHLGAPALAPEEQEVVARILFEKCEILLNGFAKHGRTSEHAGEIRGWRTLALAAMPLEAATIS